jgi:hypothetical protein
MEYSVRHGLKRKTFARWMKHLIGVEEAHRHTEELRELRTPERASSAAQEGSLRRGEERKASAEQSYRTRTRCRVGEPMEIVITPGATYFMFERLNSLRRIYTDGLRFPDDIDPSFTGYSVGARQRWSWTLRYSRDRDPRHQGAAHLRCERHSVS